MLYVERSNRIENLLDGLAERLTSPRPDPLSPSVVVVQGQGMERWIAQAIARDHGICANSEFLFPRNLIEAVFVHAEEQVGGPEEFAANPRWGTDQLVWAVARRLVADRDAEELAPLARQLRSPDGDWRLIQLSQQIAARFDDYITYRPDWVVRWGAQPAVAAPERLADDEAWQAWLFRRIQSDLGPGHIADRALRFVDLVGSDDRESLASVFSLAFPNGIEVFAVSTLPPLHLGVLDALAQLIDVRMSVLSPSRHYWADLWGELRDEDQAASASSVEASASPVADTVASLLVGLGRLGGDFQSGLEQVSGYSETEPDRFEDPVSSALEGGASEPTLLRRLQSRLLDLDANASTDRLAPISPDDRSIQIHYCHGPKRELETVESALRDAFERDPTLTPEDVIVMAPQIDEWVPVIDAVFGASGVDDDNHAIPYRIADRSTLRGSPVAETFVRLLDLLTGRAGRSEVLDWLSLEPARARIGLDADGVDRVGNWAVRAGIRFGFDASHREMLGLEASRRHTWAGGIDRLVLGHAMGPTGEIMEGLLPEPLDHFSDPALLGAIGELEATLSNARRELSVARNVTDWSRWLLALVDATLDHRDDNAHEHDLLRSAIQRLRDGAAAVSFDRPIPFEAIRERFRHALDATPPAQGFLSGGVTFCELVPLRAIPFRLIAIVGLSDSNFPRRRPAASYDLMRLHPRRGDRNLRSDDRYLFLEALISARDELILTVPSRDLRDGEDLPPSVVISELLDVLDSSFAVESTESRRWPRDQIVLAHPLHSFSSRYFEVGRDSRWVGLDDEAFEGAKAQRSKLEAGGGHERRFLEVLEPRSGEGAGSVECELHLDELIQRILRSTRVFARERLGMRFPRPERAVGDFDPVEIDPLNQFSLGDALLGERQAGIRESGSANRLAASPLLPGGEPGRLAARVLRTEVSATFEIASARIGAAEVVKKSFDLSLGELPRVGPARLSGLLAGYTPKGLRRVDFARLGRRAELEFWIQHVVFCALAGDAENSGLQSLMISRAESNKQRDRVSVFSFVPDARKLLGSFFEWAWSVDRAPLPLFPKASRAFARHLGNTDKADQAWREAHQKFYGSDSGWSSFPEFEEDLDYARVWEGRHPLESNRHEPVLFEFEVLANDFFSAFYEHREVHER